MWSIFTYNCLYDFWTASDVKQRQGPLTRFVLRRFFRWEWRCSLPDDIHHNYSFICIHMYSSQMPIRSPGEVTLQCTIERMFWHRNSLNFLPLMWTWRYMTHSGQHGNKDVVQTMGFLVFVQLPPDTAIFYGGRHLPFLGPHGTCRGLNSASKGRHDTF